MITLDAKLNILNSQILERWNANSPFIHWPWARPAHVRVLLYMEGASFDGGSFHGLKHVIATLQASLWYWVKFDVTTVNRGADSTAMQQNKTLDQLNLSANFDQVWLFGVSPNNQPYVNLLSPAEITAITDFMQHGGGVLTTGDHASLGRGISGTVPRAGSMRLYPAPDNVAPDYNTTLERGHDGIFDFYDQSDDIPQSIRLRRYPLWDFFPRPFSSRWAPHPILCGINGPINVLPDHEHEGEAIIPSSFPASEWPSKAGNQPLPEVIAWGRIKDPAATRVGQEIGVISAYDGHRADIGRVAADSTWHHFFDIDLLGDPSADPVNDNGYIATPAGQKALKQIENYYLNLAVWLAPPNAQKAMRDALWWSLIWTNKYLELSSAVDRLPIIYLGEQASDVFGRIASQCTQRQWFFWELLDPVVRLRLEKTLQEGNPLPPQIEKFVLGSIVKHLLINFGANEKRQEPGEPPKPEAIDKLLRVATEQGLAEMFKYHSGLVQNIEGLTQKRPIG